jgi:hypothetical protein
MRPYLKNTHHKNRLGGVAQLESPEFKPQYWKKKKDNDLKEWLEIAFYSLDIVIHRFFHYYINKYIYINPFFWQL